MMKSQLNSEINVIHSIFQAFQAKYQEIVANNHRGDFLLTVTRQEESSLGQMIDEEWYNLVGGNFQTTDKYRHMLFTLPFSGSPLDLTSQEQTLMGPFFLSDHSVFWSYKGSYSQDGLKAIFLTDSGQLRFFYFLS